MKELLFIRIKAEGYKNGQKGVIMYFANRLRRLFPVTNSCFVPRKALLRRFVWRFVILLVEGIYHESYPHNLKVAEALYRMTYLENWGSGAKRIMDACQAQGVEAPTWSSNGGFVTITFKRPDFASVTIKTDKEDKQATKETKYRSSSRNDSFNEWRLYDYEWNNVKYGLQTSYIIPEKLFSSNVGRWCNWANVSWTAQSSKAKI